MSTRAITFYEWALSAPIECNPRGEYCVALCNDTRAAQLPNTRDAWEGHHLHDSPQRVMAFRSLWVSYENWLRRHGLQMPEGAPAIAQVEQPQAAGQMELIKL